MPHADEKEVFISELKELANKLNAYVSSTDGQWTIKGFIDLYRNIYTISSDTKIISKILEIHLFPEILQFANRLGYSIVLPESQNWYPDLSFINLHNEKIKFAVDIKTTYRDLSHPGFVNGFTLGSHGAYFRDRTSTKNIQFPYSEYAGHICLGIIYTRVENSDVEDTSIYHVQEIKSGSVKEKRHKYKTISVNKLVSITSVIKDFQFFVCEKWQLASDRQGSGNTANIGSITYINDIIKGNGIFAKLGEKWFDEYWMNYGKSIMIKRGKAIKINRIDDYLDFKGVKKDKIVQVVKKKGENKRMARIIVPPIKSQGIKTKLVPWIKSLAIEPKGRWIEPFLGTGVVAFNMKYRNALLNDINPHIINFYKAIQQKKLTPIIVRQYLEEEANNLLRAPDNGNNYYKMIRDRFNRDGDPLDFLFLSRTGFNGMIRFNKSGKWNIPFCKKQNRFSKAYITKIVNQVDDISRIIQQEWKFTIGSFEKVIEKANKGDFIYCDPPYIGRYVDYYNGWTEENEYTLFELLSNTKAKFILSTWHHNDYRSNPYINKLWNKFNIVTRDHFYHSGAKIENRRSIVEALVFNYDTNITSHNHDIAHNNKQLKLFERN